MMRSSVLTGFTVLMLAGTLLVSSAAGNRAPHELARPLDGTPMKIDGWTASQGRIPGARELELLGATSYLSRNYAKDGRHLELFIAYYALQRAGESRHTPKNCLPAAGWEILDYDQAKVPFEGRTERINKFTIQNGDIKGLVLYWYQTGSRVIASEYAGKGYMMWDAITKGRTDGSIVRITVPDTPEGSKDGLDFAGSVLSEMKINYGS
jgi:EpsI family protein